MVEEGLHLDVAGGGEILTARQAGADPARLVMHGNAKTDEELELAVTHGVGLVVVDNFDDIDRLERIVPHGQRAALPGAGHPRRRGRHPRLAGHRARRLEVRAAARRRPRRRSRGSSAARCCGSTACTPTSGRSCSTSSSWPRPSSPSRKLGTFDTYDLGGGLGVRYTYDEHPPDLDDYADAMVAQARALLPAGSRIIVEPGRSMVGDQRLHGLPRHDGQARRRHPRRGRRRHGRQPRGVAVRAAVRGDDRQPGRRRARRSPWSAGTANPATSSSTVSRCSDPAVGDLLAVPVTGAYCYTMSNQYNGARRIPVVFAADGDARLVVRRDTWDDLLIRDVE